MIWNVYFGPLKLGRLHERHMRIEDEYGRLYGHRDVSPMSPDCFVTDVPDPTVRSRLSEEPPCRADLFPSDGGSVSERLLKEELRSLAHGSMRDL